MAYKVFSNGSVLNASEINENLMNQSVIVFSNSTARAAAIATPLEGMLTYLEDVNKYESYNGTAWVTFGGSGILQVVSTTKTDIFSASVAAGAISSTVTGLTATITPTATSSKILVNYNVTTSGPVNTLLYRGGSVLAAATGDGLGARTRVTTGNSGSALGANVMNYLDSPATLSATTYALALHNSSSSTATLYVNRPEVDGSLSQIGRAISTITLMEVAG